MDDTMKHRIIGGVILAASAAIFLPIFFKGSHHHNAQLDKRHEFEIPSTPSQPEIAFEDPAKVSEPMEPINELANSAAGAPAEPQGVEIANTEEPPAAPTQVNAQPQAQVAQPVQIGQTLQATPVPNAQPSIQADLKPIRSAPLPQRTEKLREQLAEEEPSLEDGVAELTVPGPVVNTHPKTKVAEKASAKKIVVATAKVNEKPVVNVAQVQKPHVYVPPASIAKPNVTTVVANGNWVVQCASFSASDHARVLQNKLAAAGFNAFTKNAQTANGSITRVYVGPQGSRDAAVAVQNQLLAKANTKGIVVEIS